MRRKPHWARGLIPCMEELLATCEVRDRYRHDRDQALVEIARLEAEIDRLQGNAATYTSQPPCERPRVVAPTYAMRCGECGACRDRETDMTERVARRLAREFGYLDVFNSESQEMFDVRYWRHLAAEALAAAFTTLDSQPEENR